MAEIAVVIGEDHYNTLGIVRSLGEANVSVYLYLLDNSEKSFVAKSKYVKYFKHCKTIEDISIDLRIQKVSKGVVYCSSDAIVGMVDNYRNLFDANIVLPCISEKLGGFNALTNKTLVTKLATDFGIIVPKSWKVDRESKGFFLENILDTIDFKCIIKPAKSEYGVKDDIRICDTQGGIEKELEYLLTKMTEVQVQEFIEKDIEINLLGTSLQDNNVVIPGIMYKLKHNKNHYEFYSEIRPIESKMEKLVQQIKDFVENLGYKGLFGVELMIAGDKIYFLEINLRNDANSYSITNGGVNLPYIYFLSCCGRDYADEPMKLSKKCNYVNEIAYFKYLFETKFEVFEFCKIMFTVDCYMYCNKRDKKPFLYKYLKNIL